MNAFVLVTQRIPADVWLRGGWGPWSAAVDGADVGRMGACVEGKEPLCPEAYNLDVWGRGMPLFQERSVSGLRVRGRDGTTEPLSAVV